MRLSDLSSNTRDFISDLQFSQNGKKPETVFALAMQLSMTPEDLPYVDFSNSDGIYRAQIVEKSYKDKYMARDIEVLDALLNLVVFDFSSVLELAPKLYALRYLQAYIPSYFLNSFNEVSEKNYIDTNISPVYYKIVTDNYYKIEMLTKGMKSFMEDFNSGKLTNG